MRNYELGLNLFNAYNILNRLNLKCLIDYFWVDNF